MQEIGSKKINLLNYDRETLQKFFEAIDEKPFRAKQIFQWIHQKGITDFNEMLNLSKSLRSKLEKVTTIEAPQIVFDKPSVDGTHKWIIQTSDNNWVETVFIPEANRGTLCISSQVGCVLNCSFCSTGKQGFNRNLSVAEIIGQLWVAVRSLSKKNKEHDNAITNVVMMGMGEPLLNFDNVVKALNIMMDDLAYGLSKRKVTVSTSGVVPKIYNLLDAIDVSLAVSLHAANDKLRNILVPINKKYNLEKLLEACRLYAERGPHKSLTFEYTLINEVNDTLACAEELVNVLKDVPSKINLIPFNPYPGTDYQKPSNNRIHQFQKYLSERGFVTTIRKTRGDDIDAACGQLVGRVKDRTNRNERYIKSKEAKDKVLL